MPPPGVNTFKVSAMPIHLGEEFDLLDTQQIIGIRESTVYGLMVVVLEQQENKNE